MASRRLFDGAQIEIRSIPIVYPITPPSGSQFWINISGVWKQATPWVKVAGVWKQGTAFIKVGGVWA